MRGRPSTRAGTALEVVTGLPPAPQCSGPDVQRYAQGAIRPGAWLSYDYYLTAGSEWHYVAAASDLVTVLHMKVCAAPACGCAAMSYACTHRMSPSSQHPPSPTRRQRAWRDMQRL